jgi:hypothetical protein
MEKSVTKIVFYRLIGIFIFLLILGALNFITRYIPFNFFNSFTNFLNSNALLLIGVVVFFMFGEIISKMSFPSNIFGPLLNFVGAWMLLYFVFEFLYALNRRFNFEFLNTLFLLKTVIFFTILSLIFVFGYLPIIYRLLKNYKDDNKPLIIEEVKVIPKKAEIKNSKKKRKNK